MRLVLVQIAVKQVVVEALRSILDMSLSLWTRSSSGSSSSSSSSSSGSIWRDAIEENHRLGRLVHVAAEGMVVADVQRLQGVQRGLQVDFHAC